jgi:hypothetical protein
MLPRVQSSFIAPFNINVTVVFDGYMLQDSHLLNPNNYIVSHGAYVTNVSANPDEHDVVVLTVENMYGREQFELTVGGMITDIYGNYLDPDGRKTSIYFEDITSAQISGITGALKTRNNINKISEDGENWYFATSGGIDVVSKTNLSNVGFILDGYGYDSVAKSVDGYVYFGSSEDGYIYDAYQTGIFKIELDLINEDSSAKVMDAFAYPTIQSNVINDIVCGDYAGAAVIGIATNSGATIFIEDRVVQYASGSNISSIAFDDGTATMYIGNNTYGRVEVYYNIHVNDISNIAPHTYYDTHSTPEISDEFINQIKVASGLSTISSGSNTIYVATNNMLTRIDTDESLPGSSESGGVSFTYGVSESGAIFEVLGGQTNRVVAVDINTNIMQIYVLTNEDYIHGGLTTINVFSNAQFSFMTYENGTLISKDVKDVTFKNL